MRLRVKILGINAGDKPIVVLHEEDAEDLGIRSLGRVLLRHGDKKEVAVLNTTTKALQRGEVGVFDTIVADMKLTDGMSIEVDVSSFPRSINHIKAKLRGRKLTYDEIYEIVKDVVDKKLTEVELASFVTALNNFGLDIEESVSMANAMVETGKKLELNNAYIVDKHSIGGVPGDKTSLLLVPIIAACGLTIPKTSSRAITSAAGTADRAEVFMPVNLSLEEMRTVVKKTNGCIVWGGSLELAPADDAFIHIEYPISIDPLMLPSIMSKKKAVGTEYLVIDIPCGRGTKVKTIGDADLLAKDFIEMGRRLGIRTECAVTYGEQPLGYTIGPALEAKEALEVIMRKRTVPDLMDKVKDIAKMLLRMTGKDTGNGDKIVDDLIRSGKAEEKLRQIIFEQGGNAELRPEDIEIGRYGVDIHAGHKGFVLWMNNNQLAAIARAAGAPKDKEAGIQLYKKIGDRVEKDEKLFTIFAGKTRKLRRAQHVLEEEDAIAVGERREMLIHEVREPPVHKKAFILER